MRRITFGLSTLGRKVLPPSTLEKNHFVELKDIEGARAQWTQMHHGGYRIPPNMKRTRIAASNNFALVALANNDFMSELSAAKLCNSI